MEVCQPCGCILFLCIYTIDSIDLYKAEVCQPCRCVLFLCIYRLYRFIQGGNLSALRMCLVFTGWRHEWPASMACPGNPSLWTSLQESPRNTKRLNFSAAQYWTEWLTHVQILQTHLRNHVFLSNWPECNNECSSGHCWKTLTLAFSWLLSKWELFNVAWE